MISELRMLNNTEYENLEETIRQFNESHSRKNFKNHDHPHLLFIPPKIRVVEKYDSHLCFVALGDIEKSVHFLDKPLLGWYDVRFSTHKKPKDDFLFYQKHNKLIFVATNGIMYTFPIFRRQGIAKQLYKFTESTLKRAGFGNFECKAENPNIVKLLKGIGYTHSQNHRYGRIFDL